MSILDTIILFFFRFLTFKNFNCSRPACKISCSSIHFEFRFLFFSFVFLISNLILNFRNPFESNSTVPWFMTFLIRGFVELRSSLNNSKNFERNDTRLALLDKLTSMNIISGCWAIKNERINKGYVIKSRFETKIPFSWPMMKW